MDELTTFIDRLKRIGIELEISMNYPWLYINSINGKPVKEKFMAKHGFTIAFMPIIREDQSINFTDLGEIFKLNRKYL